MKDIFISAYKENIRRDGADNLLAAVEDHVADKGEFGGFRGVFHVPVNRVSL